ncbi:MAG TPA: PAS domain-containing sensor histidine kinase [Polyangiaceae bacterium]
METLVDVMPAGVLVADARGKIILSNAIAREIVGGPITGDARAPTRGFLQPLVRAVEHGETTRGHTTIIRRDDGSERVVLTTAAPLDGDGRIWGAISVFHDITESARGEQLALRERALFETILDSAGNPIIYIDAATGGLRANPQAEKLFGHPISKRTGREQYVTELRFPDGRHVEIAELGATRALRGEAVVRQELLVVRPDGSEIPVLESAAPVIVGREITGAVIVFQDISAMKQLERVREEWVAVIAHDLRQPITIITGYVKLLARVIDPSSSQVAKFFGHILTSVQQLNRMVEDLLDISRIEAQRLSLVRQRVDVPALVRSVVDRGAEITRGHAVTVDVHGAIPPVDADPGRIEQVLGNLLSNAAKYGAASTAIGVHVDAKDGDVRVAVTNRGGGIAVDDLRDLFKRFSRTRAARGGRVTGVGLGLFIAKAIVEAHGGTIDVESVPDEATTFRFTLPLRCS